MYQVKHTIFVGGFLLPKMDFVVWFKHFKNTLQNCSRHEQPNFLVGLDDHTDVSSSNGNEVEVFVERVIPVFQ